MEYKGHIIYSDLELICQLTRKIRNGKIKKVDAITELRKNFLYTLEYLKDNDKLSNIEFILQIMTLQNDSMRIEEEYTAYIRNK